jgi:F0F1-type ATP synthase assembly protein I
MATVELRERETQWLGFERALAQSLEIVVTLFLFGLFGWWLDRVFGTRPVLMIVFGLVGVFAISARQYLWYRATMDREEKGKPWKRPRP